MAKLTQDRLRELLDYDPETGVFVWRVSRGGVWVGSQAGGISPSGYRRIMIDGKPFRASRLAWLYMEGYFPENQCDHENRVRGDDRWKNIRHVTPQCNVRNSGRSKNNTSGITGVVWNKAGKKWAARIMVNRSRAHLGYFKRFRDAVIARWKAEVEHGWPGCNSHTDAYNYLHGEA